MKSEACSVEQVLASARQIPYTNMYKTSLANTRIHPLGWTRLRISAIMKPSPHFLWYQKRLGGGIDSATINYCCYKLDYTSDEIEKYKCWCLMGFFSSSLYNLTTWLQITTIWRAVFPNVSWAFGFAPWSMR